MRTPWLVATLVIGVPLAGACATARPAIPPPAPSAEVAPPLSATAATSLPDAVATTSASASAAASAASPSGHVPHRGALPTVPPAFQPLLAALAPLGQLTFTTTSDDKPAIACVGCLPSAPDMDLRFAEPPFPGSFTAPGKTELVLQAMGNCGRQGRHWGCLLLVGDSPRGRAVLRSHPAREGSDHLLAHRIEGERDLLVGLFSGSQMNATWTDAFAIDFAPAEPVDDGLVTVIVGDACGESGNAFVTSNGTITKVASRDVDKDGALDVVVSGTYAERLVGDYFRGCDRPQTVFPRPFSFVFVRQGGKLVPDAKTRAAGGNKASLRVLGEKQMRRPADEP